MTEPTLSATELRNAGSIGRYFDARAHRFNEFAAIQREAGQRLLERTQYCLNPPHRILDLGCGTGRIAAELKRAFPKAEVLALDSSFSMCRLATRESRWRRRVRVVMADLAALPLAAASADLVLANFALAWSPDLSAVLHGLRRVLRPRGLLLFSLPGPDSLQELRTGKPTGDALARVYDLHEVGDALQQAGFVQPVMDVEYLTVTYRDQRSLCRELDGCGAASLLPDWAESSHRQAVIGEGCRKDGLLGVTWELVFGTAFGPEEGQPIRSGGAEIATFSVEKLLTSRMPQRNGK